MNDYQTIDPNIERMMALTAPDRSTCAELNTGLPFLSDFWKKHYLETYIAGGGSKIKFVTGRPGCGKSFFLRVLEHDAQALGYRVVSFSAANVWLHDFSIIYLEILRQCNLMETLHACANTIITNMGTDPAEIPEGMTFIDYLSELGMADALQRREIRLQLKRMFLDNPLLDNNFALCCSLLTGSILGHPVLEDANKELLLGYLHGESGIKLSLLRSLGLSPEKLNKLNARHMLRSLSEVVRMGGSPGILVTIDDMETLLNRNGMQELHYTGTRRSDTYESIRQLIDDIDTMHNIMFVYAFDREFYDNDKMGIKSYSALLMRVQNEIISERFNCFADIADLDNLAKQEYDIHTVLEMGHKVYEYLTAAGIDAHPITEDTANRIISMTHMGTVGLPRLVCQMVTTDEHQEQEVNEDA